MITLAVTIHDTASTLANALQSWVDTCLMPDRLEMVLVCDGCTDNSADVAREWAGAQQVRVDVLETPDIWEIRCNNLALRQAGGQIIVFAQDDNWMFSAGWDVLVRGVLLDDRVGAVGMLAGLRFRRDGLYSRIECHYPRKRIVDPLFIPADGRYLHQVDAINRPFAVRTALLREMGGLCEEFCPLEWDDADLCIRLLKRGLVNVYVPLEILNTVTRQKTMGSAQMDEHFRRGRKLFMEKHGRWLQDGAFQPAVSFWGEMPCVNPVFDV